MMSNLTDAFIDGLIGINEFNLPKRVFMQAKKCVLDYIGVTLAGANMQKKINKRYIDWLNYNRGTTTVIGLNRKTDIYTAILINAFNAHVAELDDGHRYGMIHLSAPIIATLLALAESEKINVHDFLCGIIAGYEAAISLSCLIQPSHRRKGYHATGTCGTIGAAMGASVALRFTREQIKATLSAAATSAGGILEIQEDGSELKPYNAANAALNGLVSAFIGRTGIHGPNDILGGNRGFVSVMSDINKLNFPSIRENNKFGIENIYIKPYASCRHSHSAIEAAINIRSKYQISAEDIETINIYTYQAAVEGHDHKLIQGINSAKMSIPFSVSVAFITGKAGIDEFSYNYINDKNITKLTNKINIFADNELTALVPKKRAAIVEVRSYKGECYRERVDYPKGEPENPISENEIKEKFITLAVYGGKKREDAMAIIRKVWNIEDGFSELFELL
jgi:2-methylcitrate dehydratase PrpD